MSSPFIVIPAHNESATIGTVLRDLTNNGYKNILVVDDASTDCTASIAMECGVKVMSLPYNLGAWKATQAGLRYANEIGAKQVVTFDADGQHLAASIQELCHCGGKADIVIGSCLSRGSIARHLAWKVFRKLSRVGVYDLTSGLRLYNQRAVEVLSKQEASLLEYQDVGVLLLLRTFSLNKAEVTVPMEERRSGASRIFYSWAAVTYYMAYTTMLCISKFAKTRVLEIKNNN